MTRTAGTGRVCTGLPVLLHAMRCASVRCETWPARHGTAEHEECTCTRGRPDSARRRACTMCPPRARGAHGTYGSPACRRRRARVCSCSTRACVFCCGCGGEEVHDAGGTCLRCSRRSPCMRLHLCSDDRGTRVRSGVSDALRNDLAVLLGETGLRPLRMRAHGDLWRRRVHLRRYGQVLLRSQWARCHRRDWNVLADAAVQSVNWVESCASGACCTDIRVFLEVVCGTRKRSALRQAKVHMSTPPSLEVR